MIVKLLTEHHLEFLTFKGGCRGSSESTHIKMSHCRKSHALAHLEVSLLSKVLPVTAILATHWCLHICCTHMTSFFKRLVLGHTI